MKRNHLAVHEAAHAVAGICFGRTGLLKSVSIKETPLMKGGCHWNIVPGKCKREEERPQVAIGFAGPIGQVLYAPHSLGTYHEAFQCTILQADEILEKADCTGWAATDLNIVIWARRQKLPLDDFQYIEQQVKSLLQRPSVGKAITELAERVESLSEVKGATAEELICSHLGSDDYVTETYLD